MNPADFRDNDATKAKSGKTAEDLQYVSGLLELVNVEPLRMYSLFKILASATWMSFALVVRAAGLDWATFHTWYLGDTTLYSDLLREFLAPGDSGQNRLTRTVNVVMRDLFNIMWPTNGLPRYVSGWSVDLPSDLIRRIGEDDAVNFGHVGRLLGWLDLVSSVPNLITRTRGAAYGNLAATLQMPDALQKTVCFDLFGLYDRGTWLDQLRARDTSFDPVVIDEVNLFVGVITDAAAQVARLDVGWDLAAWNMLQDDAQIEVAEVALHEWNWLVDGQAVIDHFQWRRVTLDPNEVDVQVSFERKPDWLDWGWIALGRYINPSDGIYKVIRKGVPEVWLPY